VSINLKENLRGEERILEVVDRRSIYARGFFEFRTKKEPGKREGPRSALDGFERGFAG